MRKLLALAFILAAGLLPAANEVFKVTEVSLRGSASRSVKRTIGDEMSAAFVGKELTFEAFKKLVAECHEDFIARGYAVRITVPAFPIDEQGVATVNVDVISRREQLRRKTDLEKPGADYRPDSEVKVRRRGSGRARADANGRIRRVRLTGDVDFCDDQNLQDWADEKIVGKMYDSEKSPALAEDLRKELIRRGYPLATVVLDGDGAYDDRTGALAVYVQPGRFGDVKVHFGGETNSLFHSNEQIVRRFKGVKKDSTFAYTPVENALRSINNDPDLNGKVTLDVTTDDKDGSKTGDIVLNVDDSVPVHVMAEINNYGLDDLDNWQYVAAAQILNVTRHDDTISVSPGFSQNADLWWISGGYTIPFEFLRGGYFSLYGGYSKLDRDDVLQNFDLVGTGWFAGLKGSFNLIDTEKYLVSLDLGLMHRYTEDTYRVAAEKAYNRNVTTLPFSVGVTMANKRRDLFGGRNWGYLGLVWNVDRGGTDTLQTFMTGAQDYYWLARAEYSRVQPLANLSDQDHDWQHWSLFGKVKGQFTQDTLITAEKIALGGVDTLRGYATRGYLGDKGVYGSFELRTPVVVDPLLSLFSDRTGCSPVGRWQALAFVDWGYLSYTKEVRGFEKSELLYSAGLGIRFSLTRYLQLGADFGVPLATGYLDDYDDDFEAYLSLRGQY